jgi:patatin-like phospholipase/acyl hydrolase
MPGRFQILALSGGGFFGLYTISILAELEEELGEPIGRCFDLVAGTSVGGIIALGLAAEVPALKIKKAFEENGSLIFSNRRVPKSKLGMLRDLLRFVGKPKYNGKALRTTVAEIVGEKRLIGELVHRVIVPAVNVTKGSVQVFKTPHHATFTRDHLLKVVEVALATSAAPTYFPLAEIGDSLFVDGGLYANSPDILALHEAQHFLHADIDETHVLSIGTTTARYSFSHEDGRNLGIVGWMADQRLMNVILAAQQQSVQFMLAHRLGDRYLRLDSEQSKAQERDLALDVATQQAQKTIRGLASGTVQSALGKASLPTMLAHRANKPKFYNKGGET